MFLSKVYNSVNVNVFWWMYTHHHYLITEHFNSLNPLAITPHFSLLQNETNTKQNRNRLIDTENILIYARWEVRGMRKKVKGLRSTDWQLQNSHADVEYSLGNTVINSLLTMYGAGGVRDLSGWGISRFRNVWSLGCTPETNITLYVNCNWKIKKRFKKLID